jgi:hypothetical protein
VDGILAGIEADGSDGTVALLERMRSTALAYSLMWPKAPQQR